MYTIILIKTKKTIKNRGIHVYWNKIWEYIVDKYETRLNRMLKLNEPPLFILGTIHKEKSNFLTEEYIEKILNLKTDYKILIVSDTKMKETDNVKFHRTKISDNGNYSNLHLGREIYNEHLNLFS